MDSTSPTRAEPNSTAEQLVVRLDHLLAPVCPRPVEGDVIAVGSEAGSVRSRVPSVRLAHPLEERFELLIIARPYTLICASCVLGHISSLTRGPPLGLGAVIERGRLSVSAA